MDANSGEPWCEMDISDLTNELDHGQRLRKRRASFAETRMRSGRRRRVGAYPSAQTPLIGQKNRNPPPTTTKSAGPEASSSFYKRIMISLPQKKAPRGSGAQ